MGLLIGGSSGFIKSLTVQSEKVAADMVYDLTKEETAVLTSNSIEEQPVEKRLEVLNGVISIKKSYMVAI